MPYCSIEEAWKETLIDSNANSSPNISLVTRAQSDMNNVTAANKEDSTSIPVIEYSEYSKSDSDRKIQNILKENIILKSRVAHLDSQSKTIKNKYLINLFIYMFTGVIILLLLDNLPKYNMHSMRNPYQ